MRADDMRAVLDAVGSERAVLFGLDEGATRSHEAPSLFHRIETWLAGIFLPFLS
jgi:hypothetical protein